MGGHTAVAKSHDIYTVISLYRTVSTPSRNATVAHAYLFLACALHHILVASSRTLETVIQTLVRLIASTLKHSHPHVQQQLFINIHRTPFVFF